MFHKTFTDKYERMLKRKNIELPILQNYDGTNIKDAVYIFFLIFVWLPLPEYYIYFNVFLCWYYYHIMHSNSSHIWPEYILKINVVGTKFIYFSLFFVFIFVLDVIVKSIAKSQTPNNKSPEYVIYEKTALDAKDIL